MPNGRSGLANVPSGLNVSGPDGHHTGESAEQVAGLRIVGLGSALLLAVVCAMPFILWGNPYPGEATAYWWRGSLLAGVVAMLAFVGGDRLASASGALFARLNRVGTTAWAAAVGLVAFALSAAIAIAVFERGVTTTDELAQLWHARILLSGRLSLPPDAHPEFFSLDTVVDAPQWFSQFPIGGPALQALGLLVKAPWLVNPVLMALTAIALYVFGRRAFGEGAGRLISATTALSPSLVIMSGTMMNHPPVLCLMAWALVALVYWDQSASSSARLRSAAALGLLLGLMATIRPLDAMVAALVIGTFQLARVFVDRSRMPQLIVQCLFGLLGFAPLLWANARTTGHPLRFAYELQWGRAHGLGFHVDPYGHVFTPREGIERAIAYVGELNMYVTAWPVPAVMLAIVALCLLRRPTRWDALLLALFFAQVLAYAAYWGEGELLGPRFLYTALPTLIVLIARLPLLMAERTTGARRRGVMAFFAAAVFITWLIPGMPLNAIALARVAASARQNLRVDVAHAVESAGVERALVFLREPFSARLTRRLWGVGASRPQTAQLLASHDACALLDTVRRLESQSVRDSMIAVPLLRASATFTNAAGALESTDGILQFNGQSSFTAACKNEVDSDSTGGFVAFGLGLPLEPISTLGTVDGDIVFAADLGERNSLLRERFGDRPWYQLASARNADGVRTTSLIPLRP